MDFLFSLAPYAIGLAVLYFGWKAVAPRLKVRVPDLSMDGLAACWRSWASRWARCRRGGFSS